MSCNVFIGVILFCIYLPHKNNSDEEYLSSTVHVLDISVYKHTNFLGKVQYKNKERDIYKPTVGKEHFHHTIIQCTIIV